MPKDLPVPRVRWVPPDRPDRPGQRVQPDPSGLRVRPDRRERQGLWGRLDRPVRKDQLDKMDLWGPRARPDPLDLQA